MLFQRLINAVEALNGDKKNVNLFKFS